MAPCILENRAVSGRVAGLDTGHKELAERRPMKGPIVKLLSAEPCFMPAGKRLWWTGQPTGKGFIVESVGPAAGGSRVVLKLMTSHPSARLPALGSIACFSVHSTQAHWL